MPTITYTGGSTVIASGGFSDVFNVTLPAAADGTNAITLSATKGTIYASNVSGQILGNGSATVVVIPDSPLTTFDFQFTATSDGEGLIHFANTFAWTNPADINLTIGTVATTTGLRLSVEIKKNGVLTNADAPPTLADPTLAFGVRRTDTLAIIAASGTAMTHDGTGLYSYTIASPVTGVTYEYWPKFTIDGSPVNYQQTKEYTTDATGIYWDLSDLYDWFGQTNITIDSDLENNAVLDAARVLKRGTIADAWINLAFKRVGRTTPIPSTEDDYLLIRDIAAEWIGGFLAKGRGDLPERSSNVDAFDGAMDGHIERAEKRLAELVDAWLEANPEDDTEIVPAMQAIVPTREQCGIWWS